MPSVSKGGEMPTRKRVKAFTLIELLVVIAIIAVLAAILFPVFARARESGRQSNCGSNLKQLGMAFIMYQQDNDERNCPCIVSRNGVTAYCWPPVIDPYIKNRGVFSCPSRPQDTWDGT